MTEESQQAMYMSTAEGKPAGPKQPEVTLSVSTGEGMPTNGTAPPMPKVEPDPPGYKPEPCQVCGGDINKKGGTSFGVSLCLECDGAGRLLAAKTALEIREAGNAQAATQAAQPGQPGKPQPKKPDVEEHECELCHLPIRMAQTPEGWKKVPRPDIMFSFRTPDGKTHRTHFLCYAEDKKRLSMRDRKVDRKVQYRGGRMKNEEERVCPKSGDAVDGKTYACPIWANRDSSRPQVGDLYRCVNCKYFERG
jgi:hypothetical protein